MTTITDLVHDVIGYLVTQCQQNPALGAANPQVIVVDGPNTPGEGVQTNPQVLWIGYDAQNDAEDFAAARQRWPFLGASGNFREEQASIVCTARAWSGDPQPAPARLLCKGLVGAVEIMLRGAPTTGPGDSTMGGLVQWSQVDSFAWSQKSTGDGYSATCVFQVSYLARLSP